MNEKNYIDNDGLLYLLQRLFTLLVKKEEGKGLSTNDFTDELKEKVINAGDSSFTGNYEDLKNKPDLTVFAKTANVLTQIANATENMATQSYVLEQIANINKKAVVTSLEEMTDSNTIYLIANEGIESNIYDEYIVVNGNPEMIGTTAVDLTGFLKEENLVPISNTKIDEIINDIIT